MTIFTHAWAMPTSDTFSCPPIGEFVARYMAGSRFSIDPFARNSRIASDRNDLNPKTDAQTHFEAREFLKLMNHGVLYDRALLDPPYSPRQISECYKEAGLKCGMVDTQNAKLYKEVKDLLLPILEMGAIVLSFGWNSCGMGLNRGFELIEVLLVCHGGAHNDTICLAEKRVCRVL